jgi:hypothetical protein
MQESSLLGLPSEAGGVLYPPGILARPMATDSQNVLSRAPFAHDMRPRLSARAEAVPTSAAELNPMGDWRHLGAPTLQTGILEAANVDHDPNDVQTPNWRNSLPALRALA